MSEFYYPVEVHIGGDVNTEDLERLHQELSWCGMRIGPNDYLATNLKPKDMLSMLRDGESFLSASGEALYGEVPTIESVCRELALPFHVHAEDGGNGLVRWWTPESSRGVVQCEQYSDATYSVSGSDLDRIKLYLDAKDLIAARSHVDLLLRDRPPELPPFRLCVGKEMAAFVAATAAAKAKKKKTRKKKK